MIEIGIVGCGAVVEYFYLKQLRRIPGLRVIAVCDRDQEQAQRVAKEFGAEVTDLQTLISKCAIIAVATPPASHYAIVKQCLQQGRSVFVEKPYVTNYDQAVELNNLAKENGATVCVNHFRRYFPPIQLMREVIEGGLIGDVTGFRLSEGGRFRWKTVSDYVSKDRSGGVIYDTGSHTIDTALYASGFDAIPFEVGLREITRDKPEPSHEVEAAFSILVNDGRQVPMTLKLSRYNCLAGRVRIVGTRGWIECGVYPGATLRVCGTGRSIIVKPREEIVSDGECFRRSCADAFLNNERAANRSTLCSPVIRVVEKLSYYE